MKGRQFMGWFSGMILGKGRSYQAEFANNLYDALVLEGGPSSDANSHIDSKSLEIPLSKLERFSSKRQIMLEALLFVATSIATTSTDGERETSSLAPHPLAIELAKLLSTKWSERGMEPMSPGDVGERCFDEVTDFLEKPFSWGRAWLDEFYTDPEKPGVHYIRWTEQCLKEFKTMKMVVEQNL